MKKIILTLVLGFALSNLSAQVRVGVGIGFGFGAPVGYSYGGMVIAAPPVCGPRPIVVPRRHVRVHAAPPVVYAPRYRGWHRGRRF